jgi:hypothetical protein
MCIRKIVLYMVFDDRKENFQRNDDLETKFENLFFWSNSSIEDDS